MRGDPAKAVGRRGARGRRGERDLRRFDDEGGLVLHVHDYPPGPSKWYRIEHRLFCHITRNWRGCPLTDRRAVIELIGATTTRSGLKLESALDTRTYAQGVKVTNAELASIDNTGDTFHPERTDTLKQRPAKAEQD